MDQQKIKSNYSESKIKKKKIEEVVLLKASEEVSLRGEIRLKPVEFNTLKIHLILELFLKKTTIL